MSDYRPPRPAPAAEKGQRAPRQTPQAAWRKDVPVPMARPSATGTPRQPSSRQGATPPARQAAPRQGTVHAPRQVAPRQGAVQHPRQAMPRQGAQRPRQPGAAPQGYRRAGGGAPPKPSVRIGTALAAVLIIGVLCVLSAFFVISRTVNKYQDTFVEGVSIGGVELGGLTWEQGVAAIGQEEQNRLASWQVALSYQDTTMVMDAGDIDMRVDLTTLLTDAWTKGHQGSMLDKWRDINELKQTPYVADAGITYDDVMLENILTEIQGALYRAPVNAQSSRNADGTLAVIESQDGVQLNIDPLREQIQASISGMESTAIQLQPDAIAPQINAQAAQAQNVLLASAATTISNKSEEGRTNNIRVAVERINGATVLPGKSFSFNGVVGSRTLENGFFEAPEIERGEYVRGVGGGVCQVSTTLYQAAVCAGMSIEKRSPHAIPANYCEMGQDATVSDGRLDFVFRNPSDAPMQVRAQVTESGSGKNKIRRVVIEIYGKPVEEGVRFALETELLAEIAPPEPIRKKDTKGEYVVFVDQEKETTEARVGYKVRTWLVKYRNNQQLDRTLFTEDTYKPREATIHVGVTRRD